MMCGFQDAGRIELYFYDELSIPERREVQTHLTHCAMCRQALHDLSIIRATLASRPDVAAPPDGTWAGFMERLTGSIERLPGPDAPVPNPGAPAPVIPFVARRRVMGYLALAAVLTLVTTTVLVVLERDQVTAPPRPAVRVAPPSDGAVPVSARTSRESASPVDPALMSLSGAHFQRSKVVVLELATRESADLSTRDWSRERELASTLLNDTRLYRMAAEERGMDTLAGVMRDLELVLLQTSMAEAADAASIERLQRLIRRRDLLTKMNVVAASGP